MNKHLIKATICFLIAVCAAFGGYLIERDFGKLTVETITIPTEEGSPMVAKLYRPNTATAEQPAPALLALHGYQSDKEATNTFGALELAKHGYVVLAIDQFGHGYSTKAPAANKNMSGANNGYLYLKTLPFVDKTKLGIFGHSTGALNALRVAQQNPDHKAVNGLSSKAGSMEGLHNFLLTQGKYEEIGGYREKTYPVSTLAHHPERLKAFGLAPDATLQWGHTYGDFADGSARRAELVAGTHLGVMVSSDSNRLAIEWFDQALNHQHPTAPMTYWYKEFSGLIALFSAILGTLYIAAVLLKQPYFYDHTQAITPDVPLKRQQWRKIASINILLTVLLYPLFTQWGGAGEPIAAKLPFMPLEMGNGILTWLMVSALVCGINLYCWCRKNPTAFRDYGVTAKRGRTQNVITASLTLAVTLFAGLYLFVWLIHTLFAQELRFLWPLLKPLTIERWLLFLPYWLPILLFFTLFNGLMLNVQLKQPLKTHFTHTLLYQSRNAIIVAVTGLFILWCFHFIPNYLNIGPGFDVIGLPQFGGRWMMMLPVIMAQFCGLLIINQWCYLKTGYIWFGVFFTSLLMTWMLVGGQVIGRFLA